MQKQKPRRSPLRCSPAELAQPVSRNEEGRLHQDQEPEVICYFDLVAAFTEVLERARQQGCRKQPETVEA